MKIWKANSLWRSLLVGMFLLGGFGFGFYAILKAPEDEGVPAPLRRVFGFNSAASNLFFKKTKLAKEFDRSSAGEPRVNGKIGLKGPFNLKKWKLHVYQGDKTFDVSIEDIRKLPYVEMTTDFKCVEGWDKIVNWGGVRLSDFLVHYHLLPAPADSDWRKVDYSVSLETPDEEYYVGIDMATAMHPQTLLAYKMNGQDLTLDHGAPLRLATALKYGIKNIKRIGFLEVQPRDQEGHLARDYWAERGYDWDSGH